MRDDLKAKLQRRWENSLAARLEFGARSPVPVLGTLLETARKKEGSPGASQQRIAVVKRG